MIDIGNQYYIIDCARIVVVRSGLQSSEEVVHSLASDGGDAHALHPTINMTPKRSTTLIIIITGKFE